LKKVETTPQKRSSDDTNLLTVTGCAIFSLGTMDEGRCFVVETVQTMGRLIHVCIILRHKLPSHFRWDDIIMRRITVGRGVTVGRSGIRHNGVEYATGVRLENRFGAGAHTDECRKTRAEKNARRNLRGIERANSGSWINLVEDATQNSTQPADKTPATRHLPRHPTLHYPNYVPIAGLKLVISSYSSSFSCSRLMSSLCTAPKLIQILEILK
jgi:hypothetical protein